jgi:hypothetical protein
MFEKLQQPIKAKTEGRGKRKHTLAPLSIDVSGQVVFHLLCIKSGCGCSGEYTLAELIEIVERFKEEVRGEDDRQQEAA